MKRMGWMVLLVFVFQTGCIFLVGAAAGALGIHALGNDGSEATVNAPYGRVWSTSKKVIKERGSLSKTQKGSGHLEATVGSSDVTIDIVRIEAQTQKIQVHARKNLASVSPDPELAEDILNRILTRVYEKGSGKGPGKKK